MVPSSSHREELREPVPPERVVEDFSQEVEDTAEAALQELEADVAPPVTVSRAKKPITRSWAPCPKASASTFGLPRQPQLAGSSSDSARRPQPAVDEHRPAKHERVSSRRGDEDKPFSLMDKRLDSNHKKAKKDSKRRRKHRSPRRDEKKRRRSSSDYSASPSPRRVDKKQRRRSPSSSDSSEISSVFRGVSSDPAGKTWEALKERSRRYPSKLATKLMQGMADKVGRDGISQEWSRRDMPAVAQAYFNRVLATEAGIPASQKRDRREAETLCVMLDKLALGKFRVMDACTCMRCSVGDFSPIGLSLGGFGVF